MPHASFWLIPFVLFLLLGLGASLYLARVRFPHVARSAGLRLLASLQWSDFVQLVLAVLNSRGYERSFGGAGTEGEYLLERGGQKWLLSSRHSRAWSAGSTAIAEFAAYLRHQGLQGGILTIPGRFPASATTVAKAHRIELLDGPGMWAELAPALGDGYHAQIEQTARARLRKQYVLAWVGAAAIAMLFAIAMRDLVKESPDPLPAGPLPSGGAEAQIAEPATPAAVATPAVAAPAAPTTGVAAPATGANVPPTAARVPATTQSLVPIEQRRIDIAAAVAAMRHVRTAHWPTPSTLQVQVDSVDFDPQAICPMLETDQDLGASRLQVQYPPESDRPVRFLQCRPY